MAIYILIENDEAKAIERVLKNSITWPSDIAIPLRALLDKRHETIRSMRAYEAAADTARELYEDKDTISIDDTPIVSEAETGVWVMGWLWVENE